MKFVVIIFVILKVSAILTESSCHCTHNCPQFPQKPCRSCQPGWFGQYCQKQNIARGQYANQSSTYQSQMYGGPYPASYAVDGNTDNDLGHNSCSHTDDPYSVQRGSWWKVFLGPKKYNISQMEIILRPGYPERKDGLKVFVDEHLCYTIPIPTPANNILDIKCGSILNGNSITVSIYGSLLSLCEVRIFVCSDGWFGADCDKQCQCSDTSEVCDKDTGYCRSGCTAGKHGDGCQEDCVDGYYGKMCPTKCGRCKDDHTCNKVSGVCDNGCEVNFVSPLCQMCVPGRYGPNCSSLCGQCKGDWGCDQTTGWCPYGCLPGYAGLLCVQDCDDFTYGHNCTEVCSCLNQCEVCNKVTGACHTGYLTTVARSSGYHSTMARNNGLHSTMATYAGYQTKTSELNIPLTVVGSLLAVCCVALSVVVILYIRTRKEFSRYKAEKEEHYSSLENRTEPSVYAVIQGSQPYANVN